MLNDVKLKENDSVNYLDVSLSHAKPNIHFDNRMNSRRKAYYAMQDAGFNNINSYIDTLSYIWKAAIRPVLTYCCNSMYISKKSLSNMEKVQTKLLKPSVGLQKYYKSTPVLRAPNANKIETTVEISSLDLIRTLFSNTSRARSFYTHLLNIHVCGKLVGHTDLITRVKTVCFKHEVSFLNFLMINVMQTKQELT